MTFRVDLRRSTLAFGLLGLGMLALATEALHAQLSQKQEAARIATSAELVRRIGLTDLALFTEARYTRHPSMADLHAAFQDSPMSFEHFPSGTFAPRPETFGTGTLGFGAEETAQ